MTLLNFPTQLDFYQHHYSQQESWQPFADTQAFLHLVNQTRRPLIHIWTTEPTIILGMRDQRLPELNSGLAFLSQQNYHYYVRNSGGLGIVSDTGVLNFSLILPPTIQLNVTAAYQLITDLLRAILADCCPPIDIGEIATSYCPGNYDLSIQGKKIAGIAQRRSHQATAIMAYLSLAGDQTQRSEIMANFYHQSHAQPPDFPQINPKSMTTISQITGNQLSTAEFVQLLEQLFVSHHLILDPSFHDLLDQPEFQTYQQQAAVKLKQLNQSLS